MCARQHSHERGNLTLESRSFSFIDQLSLLDLKFEGFVIRREIFDQTFELLDLPAVGSLECGDAVLIELLDAMDLSQGELLYKIYQICVGFGILDVLCKFGVEMG